MLEDTTGQEAEGLPGNKQELLRRIDETWSDLLQTIDGVNEAMLVEPGITGWSIKDNLAHLTAWEQVLLRHLMNGEPFAVALGVDARELEGRDEDGVNDVIFQRNQHRPPAEVLADLRRSHEQVRSALEGMAFEDLISPQAMDGEPLLASVAGNTYEHYRHHRADLEALLVPPVLGD